jgi:hypothetical protein
MTNFIFPVISTYVRHLVHSVGTKDSVTLMIESLDRKYEFQPRTGYRFFFFSKHDYAVSKDRKQALNPHL